MVGVYLCARKHRIPGYKIIYNDIIHYEGIDICCDCLEVDLSNYDFIIATPPCNYYSRANYRRNISDAALSTKHLLPSLICKCIKSKKPFIIENVMNSSLLPKADIYTFDFGNHTFYTNVLFLVYDKSFSVKQNKQHVCRNKRDNNYNVDLIIKLFLETIHQGAD